MYHRVHDAVVDPWGLCVSPERFADQIAALRDQATVVPLSALSGPFIDLPERTVVITFDDGYVDNLSHALPVLEAGQTPATLFVATAHMDRANDEFWWDRLESAVLSVGSLPDRLELTLPDGQRTWELGAAASYTVDQRAADRGRDPNQAGRDERLGFFREVYYALWHWEPVVRDRLLNEVIAWSGAAVNADPQRRVLTTPQVRAVAASGVVEIGGHTVDHLPLPRHDVAEQRYQVAAGKLQLEGMLDREITSFAYPHGTYDESTLEVVGQAGFQRAVTVHGRATVEGEERLALPRFAVPDVGGEQLLQLLEEWWTRS
jgi:peptidoglycan/xylan/chitin deacetylase (PgdA/CDA1 family)